MAERVRPLPAVLRLCLCAVAVAHPVRYDSSAESDNAERQRLSSGALQRASIGEYAMLVYSPSVAVYSPLDADATGVLLHDWAAGVPHYASCAYFGQSVYCVGENSAKTWRLSRVDGSPLPPGPDLNRYVEWPGNGRLANVDDEWLVTCGDWRFDQPNTCQVLHVNASQWVDVESEACGTHAAVAEHYGRAFVAGGYCSGPSAEVWSLQVGRTAAGKDTFQWRRHPHMNTARGLLAIASHQGYLYACGGMSGNNALSDCERWREGMHSWQSIAPLPEPRERLHMLSVDGHLIAMGGYGEIVSKAYKLDVFDYNEAEDTWSRLHDMPHMHWFGSAVVPAM